MQQDSLFTKIINGEIPCHKVHEDDKTFVLMDIYPIQTGQVLVVPKAQVGFIWDLSEEDYQAVMATVQKVGQRIREVFPDKKRVGVVVEGLDVEDHAHIKVFPFNDDKEFRNVPNKSDEPDHELLEQIAQKLAF